MPSPIKEIPVKIAIRHIIVLLAACGMSGFAVASGAQTWIQNASDTTVRVSIREPFSDQVALINCEVRSGCTKPVECLYLQCVVLNPRSFVSVFFTTKVPEKFGAYVGDIVVDNQGASMSPPTASFSFHYVTRSDGIPYIEAVYQMVGHAWRSKTSGKIHYPKKHLVQLDRQSASINTDNPGSWLVINTAPAKWQYH